MILFFFFLSIIFITNNSIMFIFVISHDKIVAIVQHKVNSLEIIIEIIIFMLYHACLIVTHGE